MTALLKSGDRTNQTNHRPISILPTLSKILESVIHCQLYEYLDSNNLLSIMQFWFSFLTFHSHCIVWLCRWSLIKHGKREHLWCFISGSFRGVRCSRLWDLDVQIVISWSLPPVFGVVLFSKPLVIINYPKPFPLLSGFHKEASWDPYCSLCINYQRATCGYSTLRGIIVRWRCCSLPLRKRTSRAGEQVERRSLQRSIVAKSE